MSALIADEKHIVSPCPSSGAYALIILTPDVWIPRRKHRWPAQRLPSSSLEDYLSQISTSNNTFYNRALSLPALMEAENLEMLRHVFDPFLIAFVDGWSTIRKTSERYPLDNYTTHWFSFARTSDWKSSCTPRSSSLSSSLPKRRHLFVTLW